MRHPDVRPALVLLSLVLVISSSAGERLEEPDPTTARTTPGALRSGAIASSEPTEPPLPRTRTAPLVVGEPVEPALDAAARAFVEFARGGTPDQQLLRHDVDLFLGGRLVHTIPAWRAVRRLSYGYLCSTSRSYAARVCPFSAVRTLALEKSRIAITSQPHDRRCGGGRSIRRRYPQVTTLVPRRPRSCLDDFAVEVALDGDGGLAAVNLVLSEP